MSDSERTSQPMGEKVDSVASMESILQCVAQPVWVVDHDGNVVFVNAAGLHALGYDELSELKGRFGHDAIHYKHRDGRRTPPRTAR
jgi:PAS domain S-box-containing protein